MRTRNCLTAVLLFCFAASSAEARSKSWISKTTWTFVDDGTTIRESIDDRGNYIMNTANGKHVDHGSIAIKHGKVCHTSAMNNDGEVCWIVPRAKVGHTVTATSPNGRKLKVTRIAYTPLSMK